MINLTDHNSVKEKQRPANNTYSKVAVQCLNQALCFYQSLCLVNSEVLRSRKFSERHLRVASNRWWQVKKNASTEKNTTYCILTAIAQKHYLCKKA